MDTPAKRVAPRVPSHCSERPGACAQCRNLEREQREEEHAKALAWLLSYTAEKGYPGKVPCYLSQACTQVENAQKLHLPEDVQLIIAERAGRYRVEFPVTVLDTGLVPICRKCYQWTRDKVLFDDC